VALSYRPRRKPGSTSSANDLSHEFVGFSSALSPVLGPDLVENAQPPHRELIDFKRPQSRPPDGQAANGEPSDRQGTDSDGTKRRSRNRGSRQTAGRCDFDRGKDSLRWRDRRAVISNVIHLLPLPTGSTNAKNQLIVASDATYRAETALQEPP
jgi:hypothetical protein